LQPGLAARLREKRSAAPTQGDEGAFPTMTIGGRVEAGVKTNVVPDYAVMAIDRRLILEESVEEARREIDKVIQELSFGGRSAAAWQERPGYPIRGRPTCLL
jgi:succinyl-diaminopimelate desuccinylase